jgi:hypothetical protein
MGYCYQADHNYYTLELDKFQKVYDLLLTICHEMVHVKQGVRRELTERHLKQYWKGIQHSDRRNEPWEREAWDMQKKLAHSFIKGTGNSVKYVKSVDKRCMELY